VWAIDSPDYERAEAAIRQGLWDTGIQLLTPLLQQSVPAPQAAKIHNLYGIALTGKGDLALANRQFEQALRIEPRFAPALKNLAVNEFTLKKTADADRHLRLALELLPADPVVHAYLGEIDYGRRQFKSSADHFLRAEKMVLGDPTATVHLLDGLLESNQRPTALDVLGKLQSVDPSPQLQFRIGLLLAKHQWFEQAISYFRGAERLPGSYDASFDLAICYVETKQYPQAIEVLQRLVQSGPKVAEAINLLGEAYEKNNQIKEAIEALRQATLLFPEDEDNYVDLASLCINHDAYDLGLEIIEVGLRHRPNSARLILERGLLQAMQNHFDLADKDFQLSSSLAPEKDLSYVGLGLSYMEEGKLPAALRLLRQRIKHKPNDATLQYLLGEGLMRSGASPGEPAFREAKAALRKSLGLNPKSASAHIAFAKLLLKQGGVEQAVAHLETACSLDPAQKAAYSQLAIAYRRIGKTEKAKDMLAILSKLNDEERLEDSRQHIRIVKAEP
jgi:tetratricopeptide (TPR) repeat protein